MAHLTLRSTAAAQVHAYGDVGLRHSTLKVRGPTSKPSLLARRSSGVPLPASYRWPWRHSRSTSMTVFWLVVAVAAVVAVIWALKNVLSKELSCRHGPPRNPVLLWRSRRGRRTNEGKLVLHLIPSFVLRSVHRTVDRDLLPLGRSGASASKPSCRRVVKRHDAVCTNCGAELEFPDVALAPEAAIRGGLRQ